MSYPDAILHATGVRLAYLILLSVLATNLLCNSSDCVDKGDSKDAAQNAAVSSPSSVFAAVAQYEGSGGGHGRRPGLRRTVIGIRWAIMVLILNSSMR